MRASRIGSLVACASLLIACATGGDAIDDGQPGLLGGGGAGQDGGGAMSASSSSSSSGGGSGSGSSSGGGDDASSVVDSGSGEDASAFDAGLGDDGGGSSSSSSGGGTDGGGTVSNFCGSNPAYYLEAFTAYTGGSAKLCAQNADCGAGDCCFQASKQLPVNVCIKQ